MAIEKSFLYSIKDSEKITNIPKRTLSRYALKNNNRKIDGRYLFLGSQLEELIEKRLKKKQKREKPSPTPRQNKTLATLKGNGEVVAKEEYDALKTENETLKDKLSEYDIADNERLEIFTKEEYSKFEERLTEWHLQTQHIVAQQELFDAKEKGLNDVVGLMTEQAEHYKNQFQYQKEQSTRILDMHEQLIKTIQQNNFIEAKSKGFDKE